MKALLHDMATAVHPNYDAEDEAVAYTHLAGIRSWLASDAAHAVAMVAVDQAMRKGGGWLTYGDTVRAAMDGLAASLKYPHE